MTTLSINLDSGHERFIQQAVMSGRYTDESEVIAEALTELETREETLAQDLEAMHEEVGRGLAQLHRGEVKEWDLPEAQRAWRKRLAEQLQ